MLWFKTSEAAIEYVGKFCHTDFQQGQAYPAYVISTLGYEENGRTGMYQLNIDGTDRWAVGKIETTHNQFQRGDFVLWGCNGLGLMRRYEGLIIAELEFGIDMTTDQWIIKREI